MCFMAKTKQFTVNVRGPSFIMARALTHVIASPFGNLKYLAIEHGTCTIDVPIKVVIMQSYLSLSEGDLVTVSESPLS